MIGKKSERSLERIGRGIPLELVKYMKTNVQILSWVNSFLKKLNMHFQWERWLNTITDPIKRMAI